MKHGLLVLALACWLGAALNAQELSCARVALTLAELEAVEGGDLWLSVDRQNQTMTVTRLTPGNYDSIQCYTVPVTTSVVRNQDVTSTNPKNSMENTERLVNSDKQKVFSKQFPTGTANIDPVVGTSPLVTGPVIRTDATQKVTVVDDDKKPVSTKPDYGYNVHFEDPKKSTNTLGCIGVTDLSNMNRIVDTLKTDNASSSKPSQTVHVTPPPTVLPPPAVKPNSFVRPNKAL